MDEIEAKKRKVFMNAFDKINISLTVYFAKLTGGGEATLKLENPEEPFSGGIDMIVQFPNKPSSLSAEQAAANAPSQQSPSYSRLKSSRLHPSTSLTKLTPT